MSASNFIPIKTILGNELVVLVLNWSKLLISFAIIFIMSKFILFFLINYFILGIICLDIRQFYLIVINCFSFKYQIILLN